MRLFPVSIAFACAAAWACAASAAPAVAGLPASVPEGFYSCMTYGSVSASVGKLRILGRGLSSGVTPDGSGPQHHYSYDASTAPSPGPTG